MTARKAKARAKNKSKMWVPSASLRTGSSTSSLAERASDFAQDDRFLGSLMMGSSPTFARSGTLRMGHPFVVAVL